MVGRDDRDGQTPGLQGRAWVIRVVLVDDQALVRTGLRMVLEADPVRVLVLTTYDVDEYVFEALRAGACGFLLKHTSPEGLVEAVRTVASGDGLIAPAVTRRLIAEITRELVVGPATVKTHIGRVLTKLGLRDRVEAVIWAYEAGVVRPGR
jgi:DNA-binding NarL/FixJ family response regulator